MEDKLVVINDLSNLISSADNQKVKITDNIFCGVIVSVSISIFRILFIIPIYCFSGESTGFFELYNMRYTYSTPNYDEIWRYFRDAFFSVFQSNDIVINYMFIGFVILSILLVFMVKSPMGILISFVVTIISPYIIPNVFLPLLSFIYVIINFMSLFIDNMLPSCVPVFIAWIVLGFLFGFIYLLKNKKMKIFVSIIVFLILIVLKYKYPIEDYIQLKTFF